MRAQLPLLDRDFWILEPALNHQKTLFMGAYKPQKQKCLIKCISLLPQGLQNKKLFDMYWFNLGQLNNINQSMVQRPLFYSYDDTRKCIYIGSKLFELSLENIILHHRKQQKFIDSALVHHFAEKSCDMLYRLSNAGVNLFPKFIKPSNIFVQGQGNSRELEWKFSELGVVSKYPNKYYQMSTDMAKSRRSIPNPTEQVYQADFYSIGVILLEMVTLAPIDKLYQLLLNEEDLQRQPECREGFNYYGKTIVRFIKELLKPTEPLRQTFQAFKRNIEDSNKNDSQIGYKLQQYEKLKWTYERVQQNIKEQIPNKIQAKLDHYIKDRQISCDEVIATAEKYDPELDLTFKNLQQLESFFSEYRVDMGYEDLLYLFYYWHSTSSVNYIEILKLTFTPREIMDAIIKKAIVQYSSRKQFFEVQTGQAKEFWKSEEIRRFYSRLGANFTLQEVEGVVKQWSGAPNRTSIRFDEFNKYFREVGNESSLINNLSRTGNLQSIEKKLKEMLYRLKQQLQSDQKNLISFFRLYDYESKWFVGVEVEKELKKRVEISNSDFRQACELMWQLAGQQAASKKIMLYVVLLKKLRLYDLTELFKLVIVEKINESDRNAFYRLYEKDEKGWNLNSFVDFNNKQQLDFSEAQLRTIFRDIDTDKSGYLDQKELIYRLTGLQQFDKELLIEKTREKLSRQEDIFDIFMRFDKNKNLYYDSPGDLAQVFEHLQIDILPQHCTALFSSGMRNRKYPYMQFLRYFIPNDRLFIKACLFFIDHLYDGKFDKFYDTGRVKNKQKWSSQSFDVINEEFSLGFTRNEIGEIWDSLCKEETALTKQEIAVIFNFSAEPEETILPIQSTEKKRQQKKRNYDQNDRKAQTTQQAKPSKDPVQKQTNDLIDKLLSKNLTTITLTFIRKSKQNCYLNFDQFCSCLEQLEVKFLKNQVLKSTSKFQQMDEVDGKMKINFFNLLMFLCQAEQEERQLKKSECLSIIIKERMRFENLTTDEAFSKTKRADMMRLTDYQNFIKGLLKTQLYFDDIEDTWKHWGYPQYLTKEDFNKIINLDNTQSSQEKKPRLNKQISFARPAKDRQNDQDYIKSSEEKQSVQSPYFQKKASRKQSRDEVRSSSRPQENQWSQRNQRQPFGWGEAKKNDDQSRMNSNDRKRVSLQTRQQAMDAKNKPLDRKEKVTQKQPEKSAKKQLTKAEVLELFEEELQSKGSDKLNNLFAKSNAVSTQQFINFINDNYAFKKQISEKLGEILNSFGRIKIETLKKYIKKVESPKKQKTAGEEKYNREKRGQNRKQAGNRNQTRYNKTTNKQQEQQYAGTRLQDPRKVRLNVPLIREHISILTSSFGKKFDISEIQPFFFQGNTTISESEFVRKCVEINSSISRSMYEKIFLFLKPNNGVVSSIEFNLNFRFDNHIPIDEIYLPEQLEQQLRAIFDKADKDKSGFIDLLEIETLLGALGVNESQKQLETYFRKIDKNFDKKIDFKEFKVFIEEEILPLISDFDEDYDILEEIFRMNDVFRTGCLPLTKIAVILDKNGVKIGDRDLQALRRQLANEQNQVSIKQLLNSISNPSQPKFLSSTKAVLYRIRWRKKLSLKDIQKVFQNISACFINAFTSSLVKKNKLRPSSFITPSLHESQLYYADFFYKNISKLDERQPNLVDTHKPSDLIVELKLIDATGIPIPQNPAVRNSIVGRSVNLLFYDMSNEQGRDCIASLEVEWDPDVEDQWGFNRSNRSVLVKLAGFEPRKYEKVMLLLEFVLSVAEAGKVFDISCGCASVPVKELIVDSRTTKKYRLIAGIPNKSKEIDKTAITKRKGLRGIFGSGEMDSEFQIEIIPSSKLQDKLPYIASLPEKSIVNRKAVHLMWVFREYFAYKSVSQKRVNPEFGNHFLVRTFLLCLDVPDVYCDLVVFWKQKIEPKVGSDLQLGRRIFHQLMLELNTILYSRQFQIVKSFPGKSTATNRSLSNTRKKLLQEVFSNVEAWLTDGSQGEYRRRKGYGVDTMPFVVEEREITPQMKMLAQHLAKAR